MKRAVLLAILFLFACLPSVLAYDSWPSPNSVFSFKSLVYAYYHADHHSGWIIVFLPGGQGSGEMLTGCAGALVRVNRGGWHPCWMIPSRHGWLAAEFMRVGFDFLEPLTYTFTFGTRGWIIQLLNYVRHQLGYSHILLGGFSAGGAVVADIIAWEGSNMNGLIDAAAVYEGPTRLWGILSSVNVAYNVTVPTFLVYGSLDGPTTFNSHGVPPDSGQTYANNMSPNIRHQILIIEKAHDETVIVDTLPELVSFLSAENPDGFLDFTSVDLSYSPPREPDLAHRGGTGLSYPVPLITSTF